MVELWDRQKGETNRDYYFFCLYRDLFPSERSFAKLQEVLSEQGKKITRERLWQISRRNHWQERLRAYDDYLLEKARLKREQEKEEMVERHLMVARGLQGIGAQAIKRLRPEEVAPYVAVQMVREGIKIERTTLGLPGDIVQNEITPSVSGSEDWEIIKKIQELTLLLEKNGDSGTS